MKYYIKNLTIKASCNKGLRQGKRKNIVRVELIRRG